MRKYHSLDETGPPILLLQAMFMVAARFTANQQSSDGRSISPRVFYKKTKALYNAGYEKDSVTILQAVILLGMYWDGPDDLTECGIFYWSRLGTALAQAYGIHDREIYTDLNHSEKSLRKRIWWTLYTRDRSVAAAFGRPLHIDLSDSTVDPLTESDFIERDEQLQIEYPSDKTQARFFIEYVKLCQLMDLGLCLKLSSRSIQDNRRAEAAQCELGLSEWLAFCPLELQWRQSRHTFLSGVLFSAFYTIICQLQLLQEPDSSNESQKSSFHAASTVISILETLYSHGQLQYAPSFMSAVSFVTLQHQMEASVPSLLHAIRLKLDANLEMLEVLSQTWPIAGMMLELFQTTATPAHFDRLLTAVVDDCHRRSLGETNDTSSGSRSFQRSRLRQVILPQSRVVLQLLARTSQNRMTAISRPILGDVYSDAEVENESAGLRPGEIHLNGSPDAFSSALETDPSAILQNLQEIIRIGRSNMPNNDHHLS
ncbi:transcription factor domain-containing protein [Aspergillus glaucus CBS 516.65]|uniref:Xylanolytic transcriptional activator regulatory domain-containing protein n=1 Tax=Aspergillus glaucus CBS 516.65 TaxID=1160497 RepID=A0A1L9VX69_ASPGL|nr:hypothetical protein ASPGLDRAFT_141075 [Aspergillus glaucus CBS 516.65]OJJ88513.1 hypothetical protein ASPGLDRAFT_141075 [Aspergillus glaucus CBS 516.65]